MLRIPGIRFHHGAPLTLLIWSQSLGTFYDWTNVRSWHTVFDTRVQIINSRQSSGDRRDTVTPDICTCRNTVTTMTLSDPACAVLPVLLHMPIRHGDPFRALRCRPSASSMQASPPGASVWSPPTERRCTSTPGGRTRVGALKLITWPAARANRTWTGTCSRRCGARQPLRPSDPGSTLHDGLRSIISRLCRTLRSHPPRLARDHANARHARAEVGY